MLHNIIYSHLIYNWGGGVTGHVIMMGIKVHQVVYGSSYIDNFE